MRGFLAFVALLVGFVCATVAVVAYVAHETALDPRNAGAVLSEAVGTQDIRNRLLTEAVPGYDQLPGPIRGQVDRVADSPAVDRALEDVQVDESGRADLAPVGDELAQQLRSAGLDRVATQVESASGEVAITVPDRIMEPYASAREQSWQVATYGAVAAAGAFLLGLLVARNRRAALGGVGVSLLFSAGAAFVVLRSAPELAEWWGTDPWVQAGAATMDPGEPAVQTILIAVAVAGLLVAALSFFVPRPRG
jgi:hypothetical protein